MPERGEAAVNGRVSGTYPPTFKASPFTCPRCGVHAQQSWNHVAVGQTRDDDAKRSSGHSCGKHSYWVWGELLAPGVPLAPPPNEDLHGTLLEVYGEARGVAGRSPRAAARFYGCSSSDWCTSSRARCPTAGERVFERVWGWDAPVRAGIGWRLDRTERQVRGLNRTGRHGSQRTLNPQVLGSNPRGHTEPETTSGPQILARAGCRWCIKARHALIDRDAPLRVSKGSTPAGRSPNLRGDASDQRVTTDRNAQVRRHRPPRANHPAPLPTADGG